MSIRTILNGKLESRVDKLESNIGDLHYKLTCQELLIKELSEVIVKAGLIVKVDLYDPSLLGFTCAPSSKKVLSVRFDVAQHDDQIDAIAENLGLEWVTTPEKTGYVKKAVKKSKKK